MPQKFLNQQNFEYINYYLQKIFGLKQKWNGTKNKNRMGSNFGLKNMFRFEKLDVKNILGPKNVIFQKMLGPRNRLCCCHHCCHCHCHCCCCCSCCWSWSCLHLVLHQIGSQLAYIEFLLWVELVEFVSDQRLLSWSLHWGFKYIPNKIMTRLGL